MGAFFLDVEPLPEARRGGVVGCIFRQKDECGPVGCQLACDALPERAGKGKISVDGPEVEKRGRIEKGFFLRHPDPLAEVLLPYRQGLAPLRVAGHVVSGTECKPA